MARRKAFEKVIGKVYKTAADMDILKSCMNPVEIADVFRCMYAIKMNGFAETTSEMTADFYKRYNYTIIPRDKLENGSVVTDEFKVGFRICE